MAECGGDNRKEGEDEPARLDQSKGGSSEDDQSKGESSEDEPARLNQDMIESEAGSSTAGYAGTERRRVEVEQATQNQDMIKLEAESEYDVFLIPTPDSDSFKFPDSLCSRLKSEGFRVFKDDALLDTSKELQLSKIYIPIFSRQYADFYRRLDMLALMVDHTSTSGGKKEILPVFFNVEQRDKKLETTSIYRDALDRQSRIWGSEKVERWKKALEEAGKVVRWKRSSYGRDEELITAIVGEILFKQMTEHNYVFEDLSTGDSPMLCHRTSELEDSQESKIMELLELEVNDVRIVGIHGRDGIGKTALAKIIYDQISLRFDACSFLAEIEETTQQPGGVQYLQTKLIFDILKREYEVASAFGGVQFLKEIFRNKKVLIVLDSVEKESLLEYFVGAELDWFGSGSRIIVTSKQKGILQGFADQGLAHTYDVIPMDDNLAFNFFWQHAATKYIYDIRSHVKIAIGIVKAAKRLPLLLKVFSSFLKGKGLEEWIEFEDLIQQFQEDYQKILRIIYDVLHQKQKQIYLGIACLTPDEDYRIASYMWHQYDHPHDEIKVLRQMSLIQMEENKIGMHSMLRCLAREIIRNGFHDPRTGVGLYLPAIGQDTNQGKKGRDYLNIGGQSADALLNVRWLHWQGCPQDAITIHLEKNENLVILDLSWSKVTESWGGWKRIKMKHLKVLNLTGCVDLLVTPSFFCCPNLERLILERCSRLVHIDPSINDLKLLVILNLKFCTELSVLPQKMFGMHALEELLIDGTSIRQLPVLIGTLGRLKILSATNCLSLVRVPDILCESLSVLALDDAKILKLPESIGDLWRLRRLSLRDCHGLRKLPESIGKLMGSLEELDISGTGISKLPNSTEKLRSLKVLKMDSCFIREFPREIGGLYGLEEVHASWCRSLKGAIPSNISNLWCLRELRLQGTRISSLPSEIQKMSSLETLDLRHCDLLKELPPLPSTLINLYFNADADYSEDDYAPNSSSDESSQPSPSLSPSSSSEFLVLMYMCVSARVVLGKETTRDAYESGLSRQRSTLEQGEEKLLLQLLLQKGS